MNKKSCPAAKATSSDMMLAGLVADSVPNAFALFDEKDRLVLFNDAYRKHTELSKKYLSGRPTLKEILLKIIDRGGIVGAREDPKSWLKWRFNLHRNPKGPVDITDNKGRILQAIEQRHENGYSSLRIDDISEFRSQQHSSRQSAARLARQEEHFRVIMDTVLDAIITFDEKGIIGTFNPAAERIFGYRLKEVIGKNIRMLMPQPDRDKQDEYLSNYLKPGKAKIIGKGREVIGQRKNGSTFPLELAISEGDDAGDKIFIGVVRDITDRKASEAALKLSEERFALAMEASNEGIWDWNIETKKVHVSQRVRQLFGFKENTRITENTIYWTLSAKDRKIYKSEIIRYLKGETPIFDYEFRHIDKNGNVRWLHDRALVLRRPNGRAYRLIGSVSDITERKQNEDSLRAALEQAEIANRTKTDFLANVSHELRTPLNAIIGFSDLISSEIYGPIGNEKYREYTKTISESGMHLLDIINDILDVARIEVGKMDFRPESVDLEPVFEACLRLIGDRARKAGLTLQRKIQGNLPPIEGDPRRIKQILLNLLSNAVKFTPRDGIITLRARLSKSGALVISVKDTGIGMKPSDIPKVMTPFVQVDSKLARSYDGTGLGLPLTKTFVEMHGGKIKIKSAPGKGTTVTVSFPI